MPDAAIADLFPDVSFAHVVSLGANCEPAHQLRLNGRYSLRGLFDWLITPLDSLGSILAEDGARLGTTFRLAREGTSVRCGAYDVLYHHEFPRVEGHLVRFNADALDACRTKMAHKWLSLVEGCTGTNPVLFLRFWAETDLPWDRLGQGKQSLRSADLNNLVVALGRRFPDLDFRLLVLLPTPGETPDLAEPLEPRIVVERIARGENEGWAVTDAEWRSLFARLRFRDASPARMLGETLHWSGEVEQDEASPSTSVRASETASGFHSGRVREKIDAGRVEDALADLATMVAQRREAPKLAAEIGRMLWAQHRSAHASQAFSIAFDAGLREPTFLYDHLGLLTGETRYADVIAAARIAERADDGIRSRRIMLTGHAKLALAHDREAVIVRARVRESSPSWLPTEALLQRICDSVTAKRPFSLVRLGDGEARFLIAMRPDLRGSVSSVEAAAIGAVVWENWFGESMDATSEEDRTELVLALERAVTGADVIGRSTATRLRNDTGHYGFLAVLETWLEALIEDRPYPWYTDAQVPKALNECTPFLARVLEGCDFVGAISPHPGLAKALASRFSIPDFVDHVIPGEGRLVTAGATGAQGRHFPERYRDLMRNLRVPRRGAVFLVAAGLLGKIYCERIRELGGIALDIGALADAWMGHDTRDGRLRDVAMLASNGPGIGAKEAATAHDPSGRAQLERKEELHNRLGRLLKEARYAEFIDAAEAVGPLDPKLSERRDTLVGHARLALLHDREAEVSIARDRERSARWLSVEALLEALKLAVRDRRPLAFIRLGDGEARFVVTMTAALRPNLSMAEAWAVSRPVWQSWFGERIEQVDQRLLSELMEDLCRAVRGADILGVSGVERLSNKPNIFGFLAAQEAWLRNLLADRTTHRFTDALAHHRLDELSPFLADLLDRLDFLGVIGPHPDLANRLASRFSIPATQTYLVPGEDSLPEALVARAVGRHFPDRYHEIMKTLTVLRPGAVFLVAAGLVGKVYCARIKELGGIALDIGSVADTWMGFDTRPGYRQKPAATLGGLSQPARSG